VINDSTEGEFIDYFMRAMSYHLDISFHEALLGCFETRYVKNPIVPVVPEVAANTSINRLVNLYIKDWCYLDAQFGQWLPSLINQGREFLLLSFQYDTMHVQPWLVEDSTPVASIESLAIMFL
jgi:hypothetical protein